MRDYIRPTRAPRRTLRRILTSDATEVTCGVLILVGIMGWAAWLPGW